MKQNIKNIILKFVFDWTPPIIIAVPSLIIYYYFGIFWGVITCVFGFILFLRWLFKSIENEDQEKIDSLFGESNYEKELRKFVNDKDKMKKIMDDTVQQSQKRKKK